jgi:phage portal protein BeeE
VLVLTFPAKIENPGFSPGDLAIDKLRDLPEERIAAALGIPAMVIGLGAGLERATYSNYQEAREAAYESFIIPTQRLLAAEIDNQILPEFGSTNRLRCSFDLSDVRVLQADQDKLWARVSGAYRSGVIKRKEAKALINQEFDETLDDVYFTDLRVKTIDPAAGGVQ